MKYRVRLDMSFDDENDARLLLESSRVLQAKAVNITPLSGETEQSYFELEQCRHDEGLPCTRLERVEIGIPQG